LARYESLRSRSGDIKQKGSAPVDGTYVLTDFEHVSEASSDDSNELIFGADKNGSPFFNVVFVNELDPSIVYKHTVSAKASSLARYSSKFKYAFEHAELPQPDGYEETLPVPAVYADERGRASFDYETAKALAKELSKSGVYTDLRKISSNSAPDSSGSRADRLQALRRRSKLSSSKNSNRYKLEYLDDATAQDCLTRWFDVLNELANAVVNITFEPESDKPGARHQIAYFEPLDYVSEDEDDDFDDE
jgi:hypothetical protein